jgi:hypothetical protein
MSDEHESEPAALSDADLAEYRRARLRLSVEESLEELQEIATGDSAEANGAALALVGAATLMDIQTHSLAPGISIRRIEAGVVLREQPQRWTEVVRCFIRRFGRREAEKLLGAGNLEAVLRCELWERLTIAPVYRDDPRQLHMWPDELQSLQARNAAGNSK